MKNKHYFFELLLAIILIIIIGFWAFPKNKNTPETPSVRPDVPANNYDKFKNLPGDDKN